MVRKINRLDARTVATLEKPGRHADGGGLYLSISQNGSTLRRRWVFLFRWQGKLREMGLGGASTVTLAQARRLAAKWRGELADGRNPFETRAAEHRSHSTCPTFGEIAQAFYEAKSHDWRNEKVKKQWMAPLTRYAGRLMTMPVKEIGTDDVLAALQPIWTAKPETASRVRSRIEAVLDSARARGLIAQNEANPARWRGHLAHILPKRRRLTRGHHPAMPYREVREFIANLRQREGIATHALEFTILTAARTNEIRGARWDEIDSGAQIWTVPASRMKGNREHRVPLSASALEILEALGKGRTGDLVFPSSWPGRPLSEMAMAMVLRRMKIKDVTVHGFRSSFRDWTGDCTQFPRELAEAALAHVAGDETERAYRRTDALERRRELMEAWEQFVSGKDTIRAYKRLSEHQS